MEKVKLTVIKSNCRCGYHHVNDTFIIDDLCPPICHELWNIIYPNVFVLGNGGTLDSNDKKKTSFIGTCPDEGRVCVLGELYKK